MNNRIERESKLMRRIGYLEGMISTIVTLFKDKFMTNSEREEACDRLESSLNNPNYAIPPWEDEQDG